jgi:hypothetical protein
MPSVATTVPDVLVGLVNLAEMALPGVTIYDGAPLENPAPPEFLSIGFSRDEEDSSVDGDTFDTGNYTSSESYTVRCTLSVTAGDVDINAVSARRARCAELFGLFISALRGNPSLGVLTAGGTATLGSWSWIYGPAEQGTTFAEVEFSVQVNVGYLGML